MTAIDAALLLSAGVLAGMVGSAGGTASLISYPALLAVGIAPLAANVTNAVAFVASWPGSALGSRPELRGQARCLRRWAPLAAAGGAAGAALLLLTPAGVFDRVVPFLVARSRRWPCCSSQRSPRGWRAIPRRAAGSSCRAACSRRRST